jgi:serine/threonine protein kinase
MQVSLASWKGQLVAVKSARSKAAESKLHNQRVHSLEKRLHDLYFELQIMSHRPLCEHPNIVQLKGISFWGNRDEELCPVMIVEPACREYPDLTRFVLSQNGNVQAALAAGIIADIADGISVLHVYGVIRGDVKPGNVLIFPATGDGLRVVAKICDFSFSRNRFSKDDPRGNTPAWAAPECFPTAPVAFHPYRNEPAQDIYSFGLVSAFVLIGCITVPIEASTASEILTADVQRHCLDHPWVKDFLPLIRQCLAHDSTQRLSSLSGVRALICRYGCPLLILPIESIKPSSI